MNEKMMKIILWIKKQGSLKYPVIKRKDKSHQVSLCLKINDLSNISNIKQTHLLTLHGIFQRTKNKYFSSFRT